MKGEHANFHDTDKGLNLIFVKPFHLGTSSFPTTVKMTSAVANTSFRYSGFVAVQMRVSLFWDVRHRVLKPKYQHELLNNPEEPRTQNHHLYWGPYFFGILQPVVCPEYGLGVLGLGVAPQTLIQ